MRTHHGVADDSFWHVDAAFPDSEFRPLNKTSVSGLVEMQRNHGWNSYFKLICILSTNCIDFNYRKTHLKWCLIELHAKTIETELRTRWRGTRRKRSPHEIRSIRMNVKQIRAIDETWRRTAHTNRFHKQFTHSHVRYVDCMKMIPFVCACVCAAQMTGAQQTRTHFLYLF